LPVGLALARSTTASSVMPMNITMAIPPISTRVTAALRLFGFWKAGTPLLIASTPVSAVQPEAKARTSRIRVNTPPVRTVCSAGAVALSASGSVPCRPRTAATANISRVSPMNA
jgi:hypothetical protein